ncbi:MAG: NAD(P)-binding protein, partial [Novosphingobium sp.]|nr:NAD(P)-binding protein [Novosphingobium sp.]
MTIDRRTFSTGLASVGLAGLGLAACSPALAARKPKVAAGMAKPGQPDVIVLGAGVSGLQAAWMLEQQGLKVTVL